jgi:hypothetical protein
MKHNSSILFHNIRGFLHDALSFDGTGRIELAQKLSSHLSDKNDEYSSRIIQEFTQSRDIQGILHFTPVDNLPNILSLGFIPRIYLDLPGINEAITPVFPDKDRYDRRPECFCLSISWPNYKMFFQKRKTMNFEWAVIKLNTKAIVENKCSFYRHNAATKEGKEKGPEPISSMFLDEDIRQSLSLDLNFTTDPQAEVMCSSRVPPDWIDEIFFETPSKHSNYIIKKMNKEGILNGIKITYDSRFFKPRKDYKYWQRNSGN